MINTQDKQVAEYLKECGIECQIVATQQNAVNDEGWKHDKWLAVFNGQSFDYMTGIGHRVVSRSDTFNSFNCKTQQNLKALRALWGIPKNQKIAFKAGDTRDTRLPGQRMVVADIKPTYAVPPTQASVIWSILMDSSAEFETFNNWCDELGYDNDSKKVERIYFACQEIAEKLHKAFTHEQIEKLRELTEDY